MGANMAFTRDTVAAIGLFDELLGPGSRYGAYNEEVDYHLRALRAKPSIGVYLTPEVHVVHEHGVRPQGAPARQLLQTYQAGKSSFLTKHAMRGDLGAACMLLLLAFEPVVDAARNLLRTGKPSGIGMAAPYAKGVWRGLRVGLRSRTLYPDRPHRAA
jgi:GT2 family glycosyltransferase